MYEEISVYNLKDKKNIIDLRSEQSYNNNHIDGAINIPFDKLILDPNKYLDKNTMYYLYCRVGYTSRNACRILSTQGYKVTNIIGGYERWVLEYKE